MKKVDKVRLQVEISKEHYEKFYAFCGGRKLQGVALEGIIDFCHKIKYDPIKREKTPCKKQEV